MRDLALNEYAIKDVRPKEGQGYAEFTDEGHLQISPPLSDTLFIDRAEWEKMKRWIDDNWPAALEAATMESFGSPRSCLRAEKNEKTVFCPAVNEGCTAPS